MNTLKYEISLQIRQLREQGKSYGNIAIILGKSKDSISNYCRRNNMGDGFGGEKSLDKRRIKEDEIIKRMKENYKNFEYISGYINSESIVKIRCKKCGNIMNKCASFLRKKKNLKCDNCISIRKEDRLIELEKENIMKQEQRMLDKIKSDKERELKKSIELKNKKTDKICAECGQPFITYRKYVVCCSEECKKKRKNNHKDRRIRKCNRVDKDITLIKLSKRDNNICHICGEKVDWNDFYYREDGIFIAGEYYPSIDHIKPINKGGNHTWDNVNLAHRHCNTIKSDKLIYEKDNNQLTFAI